MTITEFIRQRLREMEMRAADATAVGSSTWRAHDPGFLDSQRGIQPYVTTPVGALRDRVFLAAVDLGPDEFDERARQMAAINHVAAMDPRFTFALVDLLRALAYDSPEPERPDLDDPETVQRLHSFFGHPAYEYLTVETGRKSGEDDSAPEGEGWEPNDFIEVGTAPDGTPYPNRNWRRLEYTEETYYRRLRPEPLQSFIPQTLRHIAGLWQQHPGYDPAWFVTPTSTKEF